MLTVDIEEFMVELKEGSIKNVGAPNKRGTAKLYDVADSEVREFGDERVKFAFTDDEGNEVEVAVGPEAARSLARDLEELAERSPVFE